MRKTNRYRQDEKPVCTFSDETTPFLARLWVRTPREFHLKSSIIKHRRIAMGVGLSEARIAINKMNLSKVGMACHIRGIPPHDAASSDSHPAISRERCACAFSELKYRVENRVGIPDVILIRNHPLNGSERKLASAFEERQWVKHFRSMPRNSIRL